MKAYVFTKDDSLQPLISYSDDVTTKADVQTSEESVILFTVEQGRKEVFRQ